MIDALGWFSSLVLLATIVNQIYKQWREGGAQGVSRWLFVGQTAASVGFTIYSALLHNWVFTVTNAALLVSALVGWIITWHFKRQNPTGASPRPSEAATPAKAYAPAP